MTWDIGKTLDLVEARFGRSQRILVSASIPSTSQKLHYVHFHYHQLVDELDAYRKELGDRLVVDAAFGQNKDVSRSTTPSSNGWGATRWPSTESPSV